MSWLKRLISKATIDSWVGTEYDEWFGRTGEAPSTKSQTAALNSNRGWVFDCVNLRSNRVSTADIEFYIEDGDEIVPVTEQQFKFMKTWNNPNPLFSRRMMVELVQSHLDLTGEGYILKVRDSVGFPTELWPIKPTGCELKYERGVYYFEVDTPDGKQNFPQEDIIYLRYADPANHFRGRSPLQAKGLQYDIDLAVEEYHWNMFNRGGFFHYALTTDQSVTKTQADGIKNQWMASLNTTAKRFRPPVLGKGLNVTQLSQSALDLGTKDTSEGMMNKILAAYVVPKALLGMLEGIMRSNLEGAEYAFAKGAIEPALDTWSDGLLPHIQMLDPRIKIRFKSTVPKDRELMLAEAEGLARMGAISVEEIRETFGYDPDFRSGDTVLVQFNVMPSIRNAKTKGGDTGTNVDKTLLTPSTIPAIEPVTDGGKFTKAFWTPERKDTYQKAFEQETEAKEKRWPPVISTWIDPWEEELLEIVEEEVKAAEAKYAGWGIARVRADYVVKQPDTDELTENILKGAGPLHVLDYREAGEEAIDFLGLQIQFDMDSPDVVRYLGDKTRNFASEQVARLSEEFDEILKGGVIEGQTTQEISAVIKERMGWESEGYRADRIARTEVISASNQARQDAFEQAGVELKSWSSSRDALVRDTHVAADVQYSANPIPVREEFVLQSGATGNPCNTGVAAEDINCRCSLRPEVAEEDE